MSSPKLRVIFRPKSEIQAFFSPKIRWSPKKKKKVFTKIESDFSAGFVRFRLVGGDASLTGAELFEIEADFSAKIVTFRLVGGDASPPPKSATEPMFSKLKVEMPAMSKHCNETRNLPPIWRRKHKISYGAAPNILKSQNRKL